MGFFSLLSELCQRVLNKIRYRKHHLFYVVTCSITLKLTSAS